MLKQFQILTLAPTRFGSCVTQNMSEQVL